MAEKRTPDIDEQDRIPRELETREREADLTDDWAPQSQLPNPKPQEGWSFRWIRVSYGGQPDVANASRRFREGFVPVKASDHPELCLMSDIDSRFPEGLEVGGLLLCKISAEKVKQRQKYMAQKSVQQTQAVENDYMREQDSRMPLVNENRTRTTFGSR